MKEFYYKGHHYKVVPIEDNDDYSIIRDGRQTRKVCKEISQNAKMHVDELFR